MTNKNSSEGLLGGDISAGKLADQQNDISDCRARAALGAKKMQPEAMTVSDIGNKPATVLVVDDGNKLIMVFRPRMGSEYSIQSFGRTTPFADLGLELSAEVLEMINDAVRADKVRQENEMKSVPQTEGTLAGGGK